MSKIFYSTLTALGYVGLAALSWIFPGKTPPQWVALFGFTNPLIPLPSTAAYCLLLTILALIWIGYFGLLYRAGRLSRRQRLLLLTVPALTGLISAPALSHDVISYLSYGQMAAVWGANPYTHVPQAFYHDPIVALNADWPDMPAPYGPLWLSTITVLIWLSRSQAVLAVTLIRLVSLGMHLIGVFLVSRLARQWQDSRDWIATLVMLNPLLLIESAFNGHSDALMVTLFLLGLWLDDKGHQPWAWSAVAASAMVKYALLPAVGLYAIYTLRRDGLRPWLGGVLIFLLTSGALFAPYWAGLDTFHGLMVETARYDTTSVPHAIHTVLERLLSLAAPESPAADYLTWFVTLTPIALLFAVFAVRQRLQPLQLVRQSTLLLIVWVVVGSTHVRQWYFVWPTMLGAILAPHPVTTLTLWLGVGASAYYASPALVNAPLFKAFFTLACFAWPGWRLLQVLLHEWKGKLSD